MLAPFTLDAPKAAPAHEERRELVSIVKALADKYADVYIPLDEIFDEAMKTQPEPLYYSVDGFHPNDNGSALIGNLYGEAVKPLIQEIINLKEK